MTRNIPEHPEIIRRPDLQAAGPRWLFRGFTMLAWGVWLYLFLPLLSLLLWALGVERFIRLVIEPGTHGQLVAVLAFAGILAGLALLVVGWSRYQGHRARTAPRRHQSAPVTDEMTAERFKVTAEMLNAIRNHRVVVLHIDNQGNPVRVEPRDSGQAQ